MAVASVAAVFGDGPGEEAQEDGGQARAKTPVGPPMEMRIDRVDLVREMETNGFQLAAEHTFLEYQYFLIFKAR